MNNESRDDESVVSTPPVLEEVGPIISRQKKKKKTQEKANSTTAQSSREATVEPEAVISGQTEKTVKAEAGKATKDANSVSSRDQPTQNTEKSKTKAGHTRSKSEQKTTPAAAGAKDDQPKSDPAPPKSYTLNDLLNDAAKLPDTEEALFELLNASISATSELLRQLIESKELDLNNALFNAPPLNSYKLPPDSRKGADYLDSNGYTMNSPFGEVYVSTQDRKQLLQGREVRLSDPNKPQNVLKRTMITPRGRIYRHLSTAEEERVLELEKRMQENEEKFGTTGKIDLKPLDDTDFMNLTGGLQELMAFPPLHRISLLTAEPGTEGTAADEDDPANLAAADNNSDETEDDEMAPLASGFGGAGPPEVVGPGGPIPLMNSGRKPMTPNTMKRKADALMGGAAAVNLRNLDVDKLAKRIRETQVEMEGARKEMEALEKKASRKAKDVSRWKEALVREFGKGF